jgi:hypothetical protein
MSCICAADSDDMLDNQSSSMDLIPLDDDQGMLCGLGSVDNQIHTASSLDSADSSNSDIDGSDDSPNLNPVSREDSSNMDFAKTHDEINITSNQNADLLINKVNKANYSINADSNPQSTKQTTFCNCVYEPHSYNSDNANFDNSEKNTENKFIDNTMNHSFDSCTINQNNISTYAQTNDVQGFICITRDWDDSERLYKKDNNSNILTLNFNQIFMAMSPEDNYTPNYQLLNDSIQENNLGFNELITEEDNCTPGNYQLNQFIQIDYGNNITTVNRLENSLTEDSPACAGLYYETLVSPIILSFNFKSGFTFNYMDSLHPKENVTHTKISGVYAEGNTLTIVNSLKCIYATIKFFTNKSDAITFNKNMQDCQSKNWNATKTITQTSIHIFSYYCTKNIESIFKQNTFNVKKCIFKCSHIANAHNFSLIDRINASSENIESQSIFNHANYCTILGNMNVCKGGVTGR